MGIRSLTAGPSGRRSGVLLAAATAVISGLAIFVNSYGVRAWSAVSNATTYTTLKNLIAAGVLLGVASMTTMRRPGAGLARPGNRRQWAALATIAFIGGSIPFVLFFEGLSRASSVQAAFIHKTLIVWVAILAVGLLREKIGLMHIAAVAALVGGQLLLVGGAGEVAFGIGELMIFAATLLWSVEVVVAKHLLRSISPATLSVSRMGGGVIVLLAYGLVRGGFSGLSGVGIHHIGWILLTGAVLAAYVGTWHLALAKAPAVDVTAVLVGGAVVTAVLRRVVAGQALPSPIGLALIAIGVAFVLASAVARRRIGAELQ